MLIILKIVRMVKFCCQGNVILRQEDVISTHGVLDDTDLVALIMVEVITSLTIAVKFLTSLSSRRLSRSKASAFSVLACQSYNTDQDQDFHHITGQ